MVGSSPSGSLRYGFPSLRTYERPQNLELRRAVIRIKGAMKAGRAKKHGHYVLFKRSTNSITAWGKIHSQILRRDA
jgi:hypothetical protein